MPSEEEKKSSPQYALNPISRRYVLKTSDVYLRLCKSGVIDDEDTMNALDMQKRAAARARQAGRKAARESLKPTSALNVVQRSAVDDSRPVQPATAAPPTQQRMSRREVKEVVKRAASRHSDDLAGLAVDDLESRLRSLLVGRLAGTTKKQSSQVNYYSSDSDSDY